MQKNLILVFCSVFFFTACQPTDSLYQTEVHLQASFSVPIGLLHPRDSDQMEYLLWLPDGYGTNARKSYPLILFLHGSGGGEYDSVNVMSNGLPEVLLVQEQPEDFEFVVVSPQVFNNTTWWGGDNLAILDALLEDIIDTYQIDPDRVYLTGLSMGGYGTWFLATEYPERFAAVVSISGSGYRSLDVPQEIYCKMQDVPVWGIHGAQDIISAPAVNEFILETLADCGGEVEFTMYPEENHFSTYAKAYRDPAVYEWMLAHTLEDR